ncbi:sister chromatid cohesion protein Dcc1 [Morchella snyderi]|nr:sister chromatid cohesion protein Dcc1 [Morchella snyderi]
MTQNNIGIPLSFSHNLAPIRLIELPPVLLSLLSNTNTPPKLQIKASSAPTDTHSTSNHAVLTTPTQTFSLRQVYSSNSLLLLKPSTATTTTTTTTTGLNVVSTANSYMELIPTIHNTKDLILKHIPVFPPPADVTPITRTEIFASLPVSNGEFDAAWRDLRCFSCPKGFAYRPLPSAILQTLKTIELVNSAGDDGIKLSKFMPEDLVEAIGRYFASLRDEDDEDDNEEVERCIPGLVKAVLSEVSLTNCEMGSCMSICESTWMAWLGRLVLEDWALKSKGDMLYASFMKKWKQEAPDWCSVSECELKNLEGWYILPTPNTIRFSPRGDAVAVEAPKPQKKNKWHEKLGKGKRR